jgi:predicted RNase H-like HicB family nuclease
MKFVVTIDRDEDGIYVVECPSIPGRVGQGITQEESLVNIKDAIKECLEVKAERGMPLKVSTRELDIVI